MILEAMALLQGLADLLPVGPQVPCHGPFVYCLVAAATATVGQRKGMIGEHRQQQHHLDARDRFVTQMTIGCLVGL